MNNGLEIVLIIGVIAFQTLAGYIGNKYLGAILPIIFSGIIIYLAAVGQLDFSFRSISISLLGLSALIGVYEGGKESKKKRAAKAAGIDLVEEKVENGKS